MFSTKRFGLKQTSTLAMTAACALTLAGAAQAFAVLDEPVLGGINFQGYDCITSTCVDLESGGYSVGGGGLVSPAHDDQYYLTPGSDTGNENSVASYNVTSSENTPEGANSSIWVYDLDGHFEMYWGSIDTYNIMTFYMGEANSVSISGSDAIETMYGDDAPSANNYGGYGTDGYFSFWGAFDAIELSSEDGVAFELATAARVPEPGTLALLGAGLSGLVMARRRRKA